MSREHLADAVLALHLLYAAFVGVGLLCIAAGGVGRWRWVRRPGLRLAHAVAVAVVAAEALLGLLCPLTWWEFRLRQGAGGGTPRPFMARLASRLLYHDWPPWVFTTAYVVVLGLTLLLWRLVPPQKGRSPAAQDQGRGQP